MERKQRNANVPDYASFEPPAKFQAIESIIAKRLKQYPNAVCSYSGGADSDIMLDMVERVRQIFELPPVKYVFFNTGLEMKATRDHVKAQAEKYNVDIEEVRPKTNIVMAVRKHGQPFMSKAMSDKFELLQGSNVPLDIRWEYLAAEDKKAKWQELNERYPHNKSVIAFLCDCDRFGEPIVSQFTICAGGKYLYDFICSNPPDFKISALCCKECKKKPSREFEKDYDMVITGERKAEGGVRTATGHSAGCFMQSRNKWRLRPLFYVSDKDKAWYKEYYKLRYSDAYEVYGMKRTGCCGCPISYRATRDLELIRPFEPHLVEAAWNVFGDSYRYRAKYNEFKQEMREKEAKTDNQK